MTSVSLSPSGRSSARATSVELGRVLPAIHEDLPVRVDVPLVEDEHVRGGLVGVVLHEPVRERRHARHAHRQAGVVRLLGLVAGRHQRLRPRQHQRVELALLQPALRFQVLDRSAADPHPVHQVHGAIGQPRDGPFAGPARRSAATFPASGPACVDADCTSSGRIAAVIADTTSSFLTADSPESAESANPREPTGRCRRRNTLLPSAVRTERALTPLTPDLARLPSTVTVSPIFRELAVQPCRTSTLLAASSTFHVDTFPSRL